MQASHRYGAFHPILAPPFLHPVRAPHRYWELSSIAEQSSHFRHVALRNTSQVIAGGVNAFTGSALSSVLGTVGALSPDRNLHLLDEIVMDVVRAPESLLSSVTRWSGINAFYWLAVSSTLEPVPRRRDPNAARRPQTRSISSSLITLPSRPTKDS